MSRLKNIWMAMEDDTTATRLVQIASQHISLALKHGDRNTSPEQKEAITSQIQRLRAERESLLLLENGEDKRNAD